MALTNYINLSGDKLVVGFRFDPKIVAAIKTIDGRLWNVAAKRWEIPKENVLETIDTLLPLGFDVNNDVKRLQEEALAFSAHIDEIRKSDAHYDGMLPLKDFQRIGAAFLKSMPSALLADVPGLGKTIQTIAATEDDQSVMIWCPATLKYNWHAEILKWLPDASIMVLDGDKDARAEQWITAMKGIYVGGVKKRPKYVIANYELLMHDYEVIRNFEFDTVVCDEATRISNPDAKSVRNLKTLRSRKRIALSGTPIANKPDDIFSIIDWCIPGYLGTYWQFQSKYCITEDEWSNRNGKEYKRITGYKNMEILREKVGRFMLRRTKEEVFDDFPKKTLENVVFSLPASERKFYQSIKEQLVDEIRQLGTLDSRTLGIIPVKMLRLKQCTGHTKLVGAHGDGESTKLETLKDKLEPIMASGEKAIIFTQFSEMLHILTQALAKYRPLTVYGDVHEKERMVRVKEFNDDPGARVIIMTEAGAYGLNMQTASYVFHYDSPWSISKLQQREDRAHRIGQNKPVTVYNLVAKDTIDEYVIKVLARKNQVSVDILKDMERMSESGLTEEDIREILRL
jgi:SNF2 family DNA or RNA helicase